MRLVAIVAVALVLTGAAGAASSGHGPLTLGGMVESHGVVDLGSAPGGGELLRFIPRAQFQVGLLLRNRTDGRLVLTGARVLAPSRTLVQQIGTGFHAWRAFKCPPGAMCPVRVFPLKGGSARPHPFSLGARKYVGVELDFQLGSCAQIRGANPAPLTRLRVTFRRPDGSVGHSTLPLGNASSIHLRTPKPGDCSDPRSSLSVNGPQQYTSSQLWTIPGSTGDVCSIRNGRFDFTSRKYQTHTSRPYEPSHYERVTLHMDRFGGTGAYRRGTVKVVLAGGKVVFRSHRPHLEVTKATSREVVATLQTGRLPGVAVRGTIRCRLIR